jgi:polyhydroxybutyrate depolymerase
LIALFFAQAPSYAQFQWRSFEFDGLTRRYRVFLPQDFQPNLPVVFIFHGYTETVQFIIDYTQMHQVADTAAFIAVYPEAIWPGFNSGLEDYPSFPPIDLTVNDVGFTSALIDTLHAHYDIDLSRVYSCGFSLGGEMTYRLVCELGHRFAAVASVAGLLNDVSAASYIPTHPMPILHFHGTDDAYEYYDGGVANLWSVHETLEFWVEKNDCSLPADTVVLPDLDPTDGCTVERISYADCADNSCVIFYKVIDGGHSWPGAAVNYWWAAPTSGDIHASTLIWDFVKDYEYEHITSVETTVGSAPGEFCLLQNYPNPCNRSTTVEYRLPYCSLVELSIYDLAGQEVAALVAGRQPAGVYRVEWDGSGFSSGLYFYRLETDHGFRGTRKLVLTK